MAVEKDWLYEEAGCAECGEIDYQPSKIPGVCQECNDILVGEKLTFGIPDNIKLHPLY